VEITNELVKKVKKWLGKDGKEFFKWCVRAHDSISPVYPEGEVDKGWYKQSIPHPVHFREGMRVRNYMRSTGLCDDWSAIDLDDNWVEVVEKALNAK